MIFIGKREALNFIEECESKLSPVYARAWEIFKQRRDIVAKKLCLNEREITFITALNAGNHLIEDIKTQYNLRGDREKVINTSGNTDAIERASKIAKICKSYDSKCDYFAKQFNDEMAKLARSSRR